MKAAIKANRKICVMQYYPRILWDRKKSLEKILAIERVKDKKLRYQIRLGMNDIELLTKGVDDAFYVKVDVETYGRLSDIDYIEEDYTKWLTTSRDKTNSSETMCVVDKSARGCYGEEL